MIEKTSPLLLAASHGQYAMVQLLVEAVVAHQGVERARGACINHLNGTGQTALMLACINGHPQVRSCCVPVDCQVRRRSAHVCFIPDLVRPSPPRCCRDLLTNGTGPLLRDTLKRCTQLAVSADSTYVSATHWSITVHSKCSVPVQLVDYLLANGAGQPLRDAASPAGYAGSREHPTPQNTRPLPYSFLFLCISTQVVEYLLTNGAEPALADRLRLNTCLHWAATHGRADCIGRLLNNGASYHYQARGTIVVPALSCVENNHIVDGERVDCIGWLRNNATSYHYQARGTIVMRLQIGSGFQSGICCEWPRCGSRKAGRLR